MKFKFYATLLKILGKASIAVGTIVVGKDLYETINNENYTTSQKIVKSTIIVGGGVVSYGAGIVVGGVAGLVTGPGGIAVGVGMTISTSYGVTYVQEQIYQNLGL